ncbi:MAG TPA: sugar ABC transporter substrate-binding protein [Candidatus Limnocylindrales bacterium]
MFDRIPRAGIGLAVMLLIAACSPTAASPSAAPASQPATAAPTEAPPASAPAESSSAAASGDRHTPEEVDAATGEHHVSSIYAVPKTLKEKYLLAFLNPGRSVPFFVDWSDGMNAAADYYGVDLIETDLDLKFENTVSSYESISGQDPDVLGTLTTAGVALKAQADKVGLPIIPIDIAIEGNPYYLGVPNEKSGQFAGDYIAKAAAAKLAGDWAGRNVVYIGLGSTNPEVQKRTLGALEEIRKTIPIDDANVVHLLCDGQAEPCNTATVDALTAHPNDVFLIVGMNDEAGVGGLQAVKAQGRAKDALMVTLGADKAGRDILRSDSDGVMIGAVDYNPWAEGWSWVEAALAVAEGEGDQFKEYDVNRVITRDNVDEIYPDN